jgi:SOS-response transcriptional repressor LexA
MASQQSLKGLPLLLIQMSNLHGKIVVARIDGTNEATVKKLVIDGPQNF